MIARIKKNDTVLVKTGKDKGKQGVVLKVMPKKDEVLVKGVKVATIHAKARKQGEVSAIKQQELPIPLSNVMPVCGSCKAPCRINVKALENGKSARICNKCKEMF